MVEGAQIYVTGERRGAAGSLAEPAAFSFPAPSASSTRKTPPVRKSTDWRQSPRNLNASLSEVLADGAGNENARPLSKTFQPRRDVHPVT